MLQKITLSIAFSFLAFIGYSQDAPETQSSLITKISATWCGPCGSWGWDMFHDLIEDNEEKATLMAVHHSGVLETPTSNALANNFMITGQPQFYLGNVNQSVSSSTAATKREAIQVAVDEAAGQAPIVNTGLLPLYYSDDNLIEVTTKTEFFQDANANYYLGVYLVNDGYVGFQQNQGTSAEHEKVLVTAFTPSHFGGELTTGAVTDGTIIEGTYSIPFNEQEWDLSRLEVVAIIWSESNGTFTYVNSNFYTDIDIALNSENLMDAVSDLSIEPTIMANGLSTINFELFDANEFYTISIMDQSGKLVKSVFKGQLGAGTHRYEIVRDDLGAAGIYYVTIESAAGRSTRELILR